MLMRVGVVSMLVALHLLLTASPEAYKLPDTAYACVCLRD